MPSGGPAYFATGFLKGLPNLQRAESKSARQQVEDSLRLLKEDREATEAIAKEKLAYQKAQIELDQAKNDIGLLHQRRAQIMASPGKPFKADANLEDHLSEARDRLDAAVQNVQEHQTNLMGMVRLRNETVDKKLPKPGTETGGWISHKVTPGEYGADYAKNQETERGTPEGQTFEEEVSGERTDLQKSQLAQRQASSRITGLEKEREIGQQQQAQINEDERNKDTFNIDRELGTLQSKQLESQAGMAAAAQEIQARQQQQSYLQAQPGYQRAMQGGAATGMGGGFGGGGGLLGGLLGAMFNKGGGMGAPQPGAAGPGSPQAQGPGAGPGPTVAQVLVPMVGKLSQMPLPTAINMVKSVVTGGRPPPGFAGSNSGGLGAPPPKQGGQPQAPKQAATTNHFHYHAPSSGPGPGGRVQGNDATSSGPGPGGQQGPQAVSQPSPSAGQGPQGPRWWEDHPLVPDQHGGGPAPQSQSSRAGNLNQGVPTIHSADQLKGMRPGSVFRAPDGSMKMIPEFAQ